MMLIYTHENNLMVVNARNYLVVNGIETELRNEFASGGLGELSAIDTWPELWVNAAHYAEAKRLISALSQPEEGTPWQCEACRETNEPAFELCWNCQVARV